MSHPSDHLEKTISDKTTAHAEHPASPKVSVILPAYNVKPYLEKCITSLKAQTLTDIEFIFVDDLSPDGGISIVEKWASEDSRVRIIRNEKNMGSGLSRNAGLEAATGEYLSFVDPDDWVADDFYELLYAKVGSDLPDIVKGTRVPVVDRSRVYHTKFDTLQNNQKIRRFLRRNRRLYELFTTEHQTAIYKRSFLEEHPEVRYGTSCNAQDTTFLLRLCLGTERIVFEDRARYYYLLRSSSVTGGYTIRRAWGELDSLREKIDTILKHPMNAATYRFFVKLIHRYSQDFYLATLVGSVSKEEHDKYIDALQEQIRRFPGHSTFTKKHAALDMIMNYREIAPTHRVDGLLDFDDCYQSYLDFLTRHPEANWRYSRICANVLAKKLGCTILPGIRGSAKSNKSLYKEKQEKQLRLKDLGLKRRMQILWFLPYRIASITLRLLFKERELLF